MFKWAFKSKRFVDLGFETEAPLLLYQHRQIDYYSLASSLLHCGSCGSITRSQLKDARRMLEEIDYYKYLGINKTASDPEIIKAVQESEKLGRARKWMLQLILEPNRSSDATNEDLTMLYKSFLYPKIASINNKRVEKLQ